MSKEDTLPTPVACPFCGSMNVEVETNFKVRWASCQNPECHADGPARNGWGEAMLAWNKRTNEQK